jgi:hypothetical protein
MWYSRRLALGAQGRGGKALETQTSFGDFLRELLLN